MKFKLSQLCAFVATCAVILGVLHESPAAAVAVPFLSVSALAAVFWIIMAIQDRSEDVDYEAKLTGEDRWWLLRPMFQFLRAVFWILVCVAIVGGVVWGVVPMIRYVLYFVT
jgi:hypothetical protein